MRCLGEQIEAETQEAVGTQLEHDTGQDDRTGSGCLGMGIG